MGIKGFREFVVEGMGSDGGRDEERWLKGRGTVVKGAGNGK